MRAWTGALGVVVVAGCGGRTAALVGAGDAGGSEGTDSGSGSSIDASVGSDSASSDGSGSGDGASGGEDDSSITCAQDESLCNGQCVDEQTDMSNCGGCGLACSVPCQNGRCVEQLAPGGAIAIAVDATNVYWTTVGTPAGGGDLMRMPKNGGTAVTLGNGGAAIAVDATSVYWSDGADRAVMKMPLAGGAPVTLAAGQVGVAGIAVDAANLYWTAGAAGGTNDGTVMSVPIGGGTLVTLAAGQSGPQGITSDANNVYWGTFGAAAKNYSDGAVMSVPIGGGTVTTLATGASVGYVAVNASSLFWNWGSIATLALHGGGMVTTLSTDLGSGLALDGTRVYWIAGAAVSTPAMRGPVSLPLDGGTPTVLASGFGPPLENIAVDATNVYFTVFSGGVFKVTPK